MVGKFFDRKRARLLTLALLALLIQKAPNAIAQEPAASKRDGPAALERPPLAYNDAETTILAVLDDVNRNQRYLNVPTEDGRLLRILTEAIGAKNVVELGTSTGYSGLWFCLALRTTGGKLTTFEIDPGRAKIARENFKRAGVSDLVTIVEGDAHENVKKLKDRVDLVFIDADKPGYLDYLRKILPLVRPGGLIVAHNMHQPPPDPKYVEAITMNPELETVFLNMHAAGVGLTLKKH